MEENAENSNEMLKSWTFVKPEVEVQAERTTYEDKTLSEESDGISVISESEMFKNSENELDKAAEGAEAEDDNDDDYRPLTPPLTPMILHSALKESNKKEDFQSKLTWTDKLLSIIIPICAGALLAMIILTFCEMIFLHSDLKALSSRVQILEQENQLLKATLDVSSIKSDVTRNQAENEPLKFPKEEKRKPPKTKTVWVGNEVEDKVEILDKKSTATLPNYCYFTDEDDLFYEYNVEYCDAKRRKLEAKSSKQGKEDFDSNPENAWKVGGSKTYDEYISDTLKSLNDEIRDIKRKRGELKVATPPSQFMVNEEKPDKLKKIEDRRKAKKKLQRQKEVKSSEWIEKRTNGREEARKKQGQEEVNWYLKRKNEREIERVEVSAEL